MLRCSLPLDQFRPSRGVQSRLTVECLSCRNRDLLKSGKKNKKATWNGQYVGLLMHRNARN